MNKKILIGAGILAAAGLTYYLWKKNKDASETKTGGEKKPEKKVNAIGVNRRFAPINVPLGTVGTISRGTVGGTVGGNTIPLGRIKAWGHKVSGGMKQCWDNSQGKYVDCGVAPKKD